MAKPKKKSNIKTIAMIVGAVVLGIIILAVGWSFVGDTVTGFFDEGDDGGGGGNQTDDKTDKPPVAILTSDKSKAKVGETIFFDGNESYDPGYTGNLSNRGIVFYIWDFGYTLEDGTPAVETTTANGTTDHSFPERGVYNVTLTVIDEAEQEDEAGITVTIVPPDQVIRSATSILIGEPLGPGIIGNQTMLDWNLSEGATHMWLNISISGAQMPPSANEIMIYLEDPYLDIIMNETVNILGSDTVEWVFTAPEIYLQGRYNLVIRAVEGTALVTVSGRVTYI
jgi:PKD repeat protein